MRCLGPSNPILMMRTRSVYGSFFQKVPGGCVKTLGNAYAPGGPLSAPRPAYGIVTAEDGATLTFTQCIQAAGGESSPYGFTMYVNSSPVTATVAVSGTTVTFSSISPVIEAADIVEVSYSNPGVVDCEDSEAIEEFTLFELFNPLGISGSYVLLESGGGDMFLLETGAPDGIYLEEVV